MCRRRDLQSLRGACPFICTMAFFTALALEAHLCHRPARCRLVLIRSRGMEIDLNQGNTGWDDDRAIEVLDRDAILIKYTDRENTKEWNCFDTG
jgi:hypothetical protein